MPSKSGRKLGIVTLATLILAGCFGAGPQHGPGGDVGEGGPQDEPGTGISPASPMPRANTPSGSTWIPPPDPAGDSPSPSHEPLELVAPTFVARPIDLYTSAGEPTIIVDPTGNLLVHAPGCLKDIDCLPGQIGGDASIVESSDEGVTWFPHNRVGGWLTNRTSTTTSFEGHIAVSPNGTRFLFDMVGEDETNDVQAELWGNLFRSSGPGVPWEFLGEVHSPTGDVDRPWIAAGMQRVIASWHGDGNPAVTSPDGGTTWEPAATCENCKSGSPPIILTDDLALMAVHRWPPPGQIEVPGLAMVVSKGISLTTDGGSTWAARDTESVQRRPVVTSGVRQGSAWPMAAVTEDGTIIVVWWQYDADPTGLALVMGSSVWYQASKDLGATWSDPRKISSRANALFPWPVGGGGDRFAVAYYTTDAAGEPNRAYSASWDVEIAVIQDAVPGNGTVVRTVIHEAAHAGTICTEGTFCAASDRGTILDFLSMATMPDGRMAVAYIIDDPRANMEEPILRHAGLSRAGAVRIAVQSGGTPLLQTG